jgi:hypothetical protein
MFVVMKTRFGGPFPSKWASTSVHFYFGFQAMFTEPLPS